MSEKGRIAAIFGAVAVLAVAGLFYFFKVHQPKQKQQAAQREIAAWEQRWDEARGCLFGTAPASGRSGEALAVRELSPDAWDRKTCTRLIGKLTRGPAEDTGLMPVEHAWMTIDRAAARVATAFATHVDPFGEAPDKRGKESPLPAALEELDAAHADLRKVAGMGPPPATSRPNLPVAEIIPLADGGHKVTALDWSLLPSSGGMVAFGTIKGQGEVQVVLVPGQPPRIAKLAPGALRALPELSWGAAGLLSQVSIGTIDAGGTFGEMTNLPTPSRASVQLAVGSFAQGLVVYGAAGALTFARNTGAGFVADPPFAVGPFAFAIDPSGRGLIAWDQDGALKGVIARGGAPAPTVVDLGSGSAYTACLTADRGWIGGSGSQLVSFDDTGARPHLLPAHALLGCSATAALLNKYDTTHYAVCTDSCRVVDLLNMRPTSIATLVNDKVIGVRARGPVVGVWRENAPPVYYATPAAVTVTRAHSDGKVIDLVGTMGTEVVIVRIPAT